MISTFPYYPNTYGKLGSGQASSPIKSGSSWSDMLGINADPYTEVSPAQRSLNIWGTNTSPWEGAGVESGLGAYNSNPPGADTLTNPNPSEDKGPEMDWQAIASGLGRARNYNMSQAMNVGDIDSFIGGTLRPFYEGLSPDAQREWYTKLPMLVSETVSSRPQFNVGSIQNWISEGLSQNSQWSPQSWLTDIMQGAATPEDIISRTPTRRWSFFSG
jgi:hypothetical protein